MLSFKLCCAILNISGAWQACAWGSSPQVLAACRGVRGRRVSEAAIAEKKISILEQALKFHPGSDELLLALLTAAETVLSPEDMLERYPPS